MLEKIMRNCSLIAVACSLSLSAFAVAETPASLDVPAGELATALRELASQARVDLVYQMEQVKDVRTEGVRGEYSPQEAVVMLLKGTSLRMYSTESGAMVIAPVGQRTSWVEEGREIRVAQGEGSEGEERKETTEGVTLEEIVVTAQRREEQLQDVPISISVLTGRDLDTSTATTLKDALYRVPGIAPISPSLGSASISLRGVPFTPGAGGTIGYYIDTVPFGFARHTFSPDLNVYDLDRIEVLRGPQGTLYGANSMSGVIRVLTEAPDVNQFEAKTRVSAATIEDGGEDYRADAVVNIPLIEDRLAIRLVGGYQKLGGWIDNLVEKDANDGKTKTLRAKLRAQPTDALMLDAGIWISRRSYGAQNIGSDDRTTDSIVEEPSSHDFDVYSLSASYDFGGVSLTGSTSYIDYQTRSDLSIHQFGAPCCTSDSLAFAKVFSEELTLQSTMGGPWRWSLGTLYRDAKDRQRIDLVFFGLNPLEDFYSKSVSYAAFGEVTRGFLAGKLDATLGLRYFHEDFTTGDIVNPSGGPLFKGKFSSHALTPRAVLAWHPTDPSTIYASYTQGFRGGIAQTPVTFRNSLFAGSGAPSLVKPDKLHNYEVGAKSTMFDGLISLEGAAYYMDWKDVKTTLTVGPPFAGISALVSGASASGVGADLGFTVRPVASVQLGGTVSWNDLKSDADILTGTDAGPVLLQGKGERMPWSPELTASAFAEYSFPLGVLTGHLNGAVSHLSKINTYNIVGSPPTRMIFDSEPITLVSARFTIDSNEGWSASLFADNLTDNDGRVTGDTRFPDWLARNPPRTIGLQLEYRFK